MNDKSSQVIDTMARKCIVGRMRLMNRVITGLYDSALRPLGVKASQFNILVVTGQLGLARPAEVCSILRLDTSTLSRNVERMRTQGWLEIVPAEDARAQPFRLTEQGRLLLEQCAPAWERAQQGAEELLGEEGMTLLDKLARKLGLPMS
ncbi:MAG: DNA-binding transcriptional repressor MarR [Holophagaceae bacterium]|nr:DNA-binding transcriptional repressor MarR [Holophagaceae bacterium]